MRPNDVLKRYFGYEAFRPLQAEIIAHVLSGNDGLVLMPTGGGKSLCYQLPALMREGLTLVISPLISLMKDQVDGLNAAGVPAAFINSSIPQSEIIRIQEDAFAGKVKILYVAPERLPSFSASGFLHSVRLSLIAVDEAHCISEWGHDFRPDYRNLQRLRQEFPNVPVLALTATATENVRKDIVSQLRLQGGRTFISSFNRPNLSYIVRPKQKAMAGLIALIKEHREESVIIYCFSRKSTEELALTLRKEGFAAQAYHAGLSSQERSRVQEGFIRDQFRVITATVAFGMGIDKPDVRLVVHYDLPKSIEGYYQETGRAGRDGLPSQCVLFFTYADRRKHLFFINQLDDATERAKALWTLDQVIRYGNDGVCRRKYLLEYFGERFEALRCGNCDTCLPSLRSTFVPTGTLVSRPADQDLFQKLRAVRKRLADEQRVPAYVIFGDRSLKDMAERKPTDPDAFAQTFGVGARKLEAFGDIFMDVIRAHDRP